MNESKEKKQKKVTKAPSMEQRKKMAMIIIGIAVVIIVIMVIAVVKPKININSKNVVKDNVTVSEDGVKTNVSSSISAEKKLDDLTIKSKLVSEKNITTLTSSITNNGKDIKDLKINVKFMGDDGSILFQTNCEAKLILSGQTTNVETSMTDMDQKFVKCKDVVYEIAK